MTPLLIMDQDPMVSNVGECGLGDVDVGGVGDEEADHAGLRELAVGDQSVLRRDHSHLKLWCNG